MTRKTHEGLVETMKAHPPVGSRWRHASGFTVTVGFPTLLEEDCDVLVLYEHDGLRWARRLASFLERFTPVEE